MRVTLVGNARDYRVLDLCSKTMVANMSNECSSEQMTAILGNRKSSCLHPEAPECQVLL